MRYPLLVVVTSITLVKNVSATWNYLADWLGYRDPPLSVPKLHLDPSNMRDVDYCAETLELTIQQAIDFADKTYISWYEKQRVAEKELPRTVWREQEAKVWCQPDLMYDGYIDCSMAFMDYDKQQHSYHIARYFVIAESDKAIEMGQRRDHYNRLVQALNAYPIGKMTHDRGQCLKALFDSRPYSLQVISPYHPQASHSKFRILRSDYSCESFDFVLVPTIYIDRRRDSIDVLESLLDGSPSVFSRIFNDPLETLPKECMKPGLLPAIHPKLTTESRKNVAGHLLDTKQALKEFYGISLLPRQWSHSYSNTNKHVMTELLCDEVLRIMTQVEVSAESAELLDCSHPLPFMTGSDRCPKTKAVIGSAMFKRVIHRPGLWIAIRGQNYLESKTNSHKYLPHDWTTEDFYAFHISDNPELAFQKLHIHKGAKGIFVIIVWEENISLIGQTAQQFPPLEESEVDYFASTIQPFNEDINRQIFPSIYPTLNRIMNADEEQDGVRKYRQEMERLRMRDYAIKPSAPPRSPEQINTNRKEERRHDFATLDLQAKPNSESLIVQKKEEPKVQFPILDLQAELKSDALLADFGFHPIQPGKPAQQPLPSSSNFLGAKRGEEAHKSQLDEIDFELLELKVPTHQIQLPGSTDTNKSGEAKPKILLL